MDAVRAPRSLFFRGQLGHVLCLLILLPAARWCVDLPSLTPPVRWWFVAALAVPVVHQFYVWLCWRSELCFQAITLSRFRVYGVVFMLFMLARPSVLLAVGVVDQSSLELGVWVGSLVAIVLAVPAIYTFYSIARFFGFLRAMGIGHFDKSYRNRPRVREGIFRWTANGMYLFGFLTLWAIAFACDSRPALVAAGFSHLYIWVHYFCTEKPDMQWIYHSTEMVSQTRDR